MTGTATTAGWSGSVPPEASRRSGSIIGAICLPRSHWKSWPAWRIGGMPSSSFTKRPRGSWAGISTRASVAGVSSACRDRHAGVQLFGLAGAAGTAPSHQAGSPTRPFSPFDSRTRDNHSQPCTVRSLDGSGTKPSSGGSPRIGSSHFAHIGSNTVVLILFYVVILSCADQGLR